MQRSCVGGRPEVEGSRRRVGGVWRGVSPPSRLGLVERRELPRGPGEAPAANAFYVYSRPQSASRRKNNVIYCQM